MRLRSHLRTVSIHPRTCRQSSLLFTREKNAGTEHYCRWSSLGDSKFRPTIVLVINCGGTHCRNEPISGELERKLNLLDPSKVWTWDPSSRKPYRGYPKKQLPMWHTYRVELYPHVPGLGIGSGIVDKYGNELEFPSAFRQCRRNGKPRGIVKIKYGGQP